MKKISFLIIITLLLVGITSCSKAKSNKWLVINLNITDANTGAKIPALISLAYYDGGSTFFGGSQEQLMSLGVASNGTYKNEISIGKKWHDLRLMVKSGGIYSGGDFSMENYYSLNRNTNNELNIEWTATTNAIDIKLTNSDCYDDTDSLWVSYENIDGTYSEPTIYTGCIVEERYSRGASVIYTRESEVNLKLVSKKNGIIESSEHSFDLEPGIIESETINY